MVNKPFSSNVQVRLPPFAPQFPLATVAARAVPGSNVSAIQNAISAAKKRFLTIIFLFSFEFLYRSETLLLPSEIAGDSAGAVFTTASQGVLHPLESGRVKNKNAVQVKSYTA